MVLVDGWWGGIEVGSFATLPSFLRVNRMTDLWCWRGGLGLGCIGAVGEDGAGDMEGGFGIGGRRAG